MLGAQVFVVRAYVMLAWIVTAVVGSRLPEETKHILRRAASQPVKTHVHRLRCFRENSMVDDARGGRIIRLDGSTWLWMTHLGENLPDVHSFACVDIELPRRMT